MHLDERSAAYFGLGLARALREPVGLLATSGTAAANFLPAVVEARSRARAAGGADRRPPARAARQRRAADHRSAASVRRARQVVLRPARARRQPGAQLRTAGDASPRARSRPPAPSRRAGPPELAVPRAAHARAARRPAARRCATPATRMHCAPCAWQPIDDLASARSRSARAGSDRVSARRTTRCPAGADALAARLGYPILADPLSTCGTARTIARWSSMPSTPSCAMPPLSTQLAPEVVLRFGAMPTSKPLLQFLERYPSARQIVVDPGGWRDPSSRPPTCCTSTRSLLCDAWPHASRTADLDATGPTTWLAHATPPRAGRSTRTSQRHGRAVRGQGLRRAGDAAARGRGLVRRQQHARARPGHVFLAQSDTPLRCLSNRGANGIDGVVSSALGASAAASGPVVLVIGDVCFYHDLNGLLAARQHAPGPAGRAGQQRRRRHLLVPAAGGRRQPRDDFELLFGTPHGLDFRAVRRGLRRPLRARGRLVRLRCGRRRTACAAAACRWSKCRPSDARNVAQHRAVWHAVARRAAPAPAADRAERPRLPRRDRRRTARRLLLLHGFTGSVRAWDEMRPSSRAIATRDRAST